MRLKQHHQMILQLMLPVIIALLQTEYTSSNNDHSDFDPGSVLLIAVNPHQYEPGTTLETEPESKTTEDIDPLQTTLSLEDQRTVTSEPPENVRTDSVIELTTGVSQTTTRKTDLVTGMSGGPEMLTTTSTVITQPEKNKPIETKSTGEENPMSSTKRIPTSSDQPENATDPTIPAPTIAATTDSTKVKPIPRETTKTIDFPKTASVDMDSDVKMTTSRAAEHESPTKPAKTPTESSVRPEIDEDPTTGNAKIQTTDRISTERPTTDRAEVSTISDWHEKDSTTRDEKFTRIASAIPASTGEDSTTQTADPGTTKETPSGVNDTTILSTIPLPSSTSTVPNSDMTTTQMETGNPDSESPEMESLTSRTEPENEVNSTALAIPDFTTEKGLEATTTPGMPCPPRYIESNGVCLRFGNGESYDHAFFECASVEYERMADERELEEHREAVGQLLDLYKLPNFLVFVNHHSSHAFRQNRNASLYYISTTGLITFYRTVKSYERLDANILSVCMKPTWNKPATCPLKTQMALFAPEMTTTETVSDEMEAFSLTTFHCPGNKSHVTVDARCGANGEVLPHATMLARACDLSTRPPPPPPKVEPTTVPSCSFCHPYGSIGCDSNNGEHRCVCRDGWRGAECWISPNFCQNMTCFEGSRCWNRIDHGFCECLTEECEANKKWAARTPSSLSLLRWASITQIAGVSITMWLKLASKGTLIAPSETPQCAYQDYRSMLNSVAGILHVLYGRPETFGISPLESRLYGLAILGLFSASQGLWWQEASNVLRVVKGTSVNRWMRTSKDVTSSNFPYRVGGVLVLTCAAFLPLMDIYWDRVATLWSATGTFGGEMYLCGMLLLILLPVALHSAAMGELAAKLYYYKPCIRIRLERLYEHHPRQEKIRMIIRNLPFAIIGPILHYLFLASMILANDMQDRPWIVESAFWLSMAYSANNIAQAIVTTTWIGPILTALQLYYPKWAPEINEITRLSIDETFAKHKPAEYLRTGGARGAALRKEAEVRARISQRRAELRSKYPDLPETFLPHVPLPGPRPCEEFTYRITEKGYISQENRSRILNWLTVRYLNFRRQEFITISSALQRTIDLAMRDLHIDEKDFGPATRPDLEELLREFKVMMRRQDSIDDTVKVVIENRKKIIEVQARELHGQNCRLQPCWVRKMTGPTRNAVIDAMVEQFKPRVPENAEVYKLPVLEEDQSISYQWWEVVPPIVSRSQELAMMEELEASVKDSEWSKMYDDDDYIVKLLAGPHAYLAQELSITPAHESYDGRVFKTRNPRNRGWLDAEWYNSARPGFVGPRRPEEYKVAGAVEQRFRMETYFDKARRGMRKELDREQVFRRMNAEDREIRGSWFYHWDFIY